MPKKTTGQSCPFIDLIDMLSRPWTIYILTALNNNGPSRFGALRRAVPGISARVLTDRLRLLEANRLILRHYEPSVPPKVTYSFTQRYAALGKLLSNMNELAVRWRREDLKRQPSRRSPASQ
jgi:DNA-binding HxlR family transcriptional regulator